MPVQKKRSNVLLCLQLLAFLIVCTAGVGECRQQTPGGGGGGGRGAGNGDASGETSADVSSSQAGVGYAPPDYNNVQHVRTAGNAGAGGGGKKNRARGGGNGNGGGGGGGHRRTYRKRQQRRQRQEDADISLWINEKQLQMLSALFFPQGFAQSRIYAIEKGHVLDEIRDPRILEYLIIPAEVNHVNFTWKAAGTRKYYYHFDRLQTMDDRILKTPLVSIKTRGRIPTEEKDFSILMPCTENSSGTAMFNIGLAIENRRGRPLLDPLRMRFKKECAPRVPDPQCQANCGNNGYCDRNHICQCMSGYTGQYCQTPFCACMHGGNCTAPWVCTCPDGYQGTQCEGGICAEPCRNGGKCVQKDKCQCSKGYYGLHCEQSKCLIPCKNGGRCIGANICRCPNGLRGDHCEIGLKQRSTCKRPCRHGVCMPNKRCKCHEGFYGRSCNGKAKKYRQSHR